MHSLFKFIPIIILVIIPFLFSFWLIPPFASILSRIPSIINLGELNFLIGEYPILITPLDFIEIIIIFSYAFSPIIFFIDKLFEKWSKYIIKEYSIIKIILFIEIPLLVIITTHIAYLFFTGGHSPLQIFNQYFGDLTISLFGNYLVNLSYTLLYPVIGGLIWIFLIIIKKESQFLFAKSFFIDILSKSEIEKINCMKEGLNLYNQFLRRNIKLQIYDLSKLYSLVLSNNTDKKIKSLSEAFENNSKLKPIEVISQILDNKEGGSVLTKISFLQKMKQTGNYIIVTLIPLTISIIQLLIR